jgi:hypothetical protein
MFECEDAPMDRAALIAALRRTDPASRACSAAVTGGADFLVWENPTAVADLVAIYSRRARHVATMGLEHDGFDHALSELDACRTEAVRLGQVTDRIAKRHYQLFLSPDSDDVIACLWVQHEA